MRSRLFSQLIAVLLTLCVYLPSTQAADTGAYLSAVALNVKDLEKATAFYTDVFGMQLKRTQKTEAMQENIMSFAEGKGASLVLVKYKDRSVPEEKTARIVFYATDPKAVIQKGVGLGASIISEPREIASLNTVIGIMRDLDGYPVEVIKRRD